MLPFTAPVLTFCGLGGMLDGMMTERSIKKELTKLLVKINNPIRQNK
jgi:hypothetical protein